MVASDTSSLLLPVLANGHLLTSFRMQNAEWNIAVINQLQKMYVSMHALGSPLARTSLKIQLPLRCVIKAVAVRHLMVDACG